MKSKSVTNAKPITPRCKRGEEKRAFVVMPNHFHSIVIIGQNGYNQNDGERGDQCRHQCRDAMHCVSTAKTTATNASTANDKSKNQFGPQSKNLASIIRGFKIGVTTNARIIHSNFTWQPRFYDHIIRDEKSFKTIQTYINENPIKWVGDKFYNKK